MEITVNKECSVMQKKASLEAKYQRAESDQKRMKVAFWWCAVKAILIFVVFFCLLGQFGPLATKPTIIPVEGVIVFCLVALGATVSEFILEISKGNEKSTTGFGVFVLLFYSIIAGILMLSCSKDVK